jgi:hypothetical protein
VAGRGELSYNQIFCGATMQRYGFSTTNPPVQYFVETFSLIADFMLLSLRDMQRGVVLYSLGQPLDRTSFVAAWLIALKLRHPQIFAGILRGDSQAHADAEELGKKLKAATSNDRFVAAISDVHAAAVSGNQAATDGEVRALLQDVGYRSASEMLKNIAQKLELAVN